MSETMDDLIRAGRKPGVFADYYAQPGPEVDPSVRFPHFGNGARTTDPDFGTRSPVFFAPPPDGEMWMRDMLGEAFAHQRGVKGGWR